MRIHRGKLGHNGHYCLYVTAANTIYTAGIVADDTSLDAYCQTVDVLRKIDGYLAKAGSDKSKLLTSHVWLKDMADYAQMDAAWSAWVDADNMPVRTTVEARLPSERYKVEIAVTAAAGASS